MPVFRVFKNAGLAVLIASTTIGVFGAETLGSMAQARGIKIGTAVNWTFWETDGPPGYMQTLESEFNIIVSENDMKFVSLQPKQGEFLWKWADDLVNFSVAKNIPLRGHALVWHDQSGWIEGKTTAGRTEMLGWLKNHIDSVMTHFKGKVVEWDVVNEAVDPSGNGLRNTFWKQRIGDDYIDSAFTWAHRADPNALLFYNDYSAEDMGAKSDQVYALVKGLLDRGVPIHGVGFQAHFESWPSFSTWDIDRNIKRLSALGLQVSFTEVDFRISPMPASDGALAAQKKNYYDLMKVCLNNSNCKTFITWGFTDGESWIPRFFPGWGAALPFDANYARKPAYYGMMEALQSTPVGILKRSGYRSRGVSMKSFGLNGVSDYNSLGRRVGKIESKTPSQATWSKAQ